MRSAIPEARYWNRIAGRFARRGHYLDSFLGDLKRRAYLELLEQWEGLPTRGRVLKTDLFEEATDAGSDGGGGGGLTK